MSQTPAEFLPKAIAILQRLQEESEERGDTMLAFLIDLARTEAEDRLRQDGLDAATRRALRVTSTIGFLSGVGSTPPPKALPAHRRKTPQRGAGRGPRQTA